MTLRGEQILFRAYLQSADRFPHTPTHERLVRGARKEGLAGATVLRGILGLGTSGLIQRSAWSLVERVPVIVEIVDSAEKIRRFLDEIVPRAMLRGMITLERAHVMLYRQRKQDATNMAALGAVVEPLSTLPEIAEREHMQINQEGVLLRVFIGESDRYENRALHDAIVVKVRELGLAGATVLRGTEGFGANSIVHKSSLLEMSSDLPLVVEIVDAEEKIKLLLPHLEKMVREGMITMEHVAILVYRHRGESTAGDA
jgi:uncharacterized protein